MTRWNDDASAFWAALKAVRIGTSSVRYDIGLFQGDSDTAAADGFFVQVHVDSTTHNPAQSPANRRRHPRGP